MNLGQMLGTVFTVISVVEAQLLPHVASSEHKGKASVTLHEKHIVSSQSKPVQWVGNGQINKGGVSSRTQRPVNMVSFSKISSTELGTQ